jgi:glucosamine-phosphate N-acetyltransferase
MSSIRQCTSVDFEQIFVLLEQLWPDKTLDRDALRWVYSRGLTSGFQRYLCAVENESVVGFCSLTIKNNLWQAGYLAHIDELIVRKEWRGLGIGSALLAAIIGVARQAGCSRVELDSAFHRSEAHSFYQQRGFENRGYLFSKAL